jgi:DNA replication protein DnaC
MLNSKPGDLTGYDCPDCLNRGYFWHIEANDERWTERCKCMEIRSSLSRIRKSGLGKMLEEYTFEAFQVQDAWQAKMLTKAREYLNAQEAWLFVSGQPGCGKTHICTAVVGELLRRGEAVRYMRWVEDGQAIKYADFEERQSKIEPLQTCSVLYIDDFLKNQTGTKVDPREIKLAFEILNMRYCNRLKTIISTEYSTNEIAQMDEATGSRIIQRSRGYQINIKREEGRNWRTRSDV